MRTRISRRGLASHEWREWRRLATRSSYGRFASARWAGSRMITQSVGSRHFGYQDWAEPGLLLMVREGLQDPVASRSLPERRPDPRNFGASTTPLTRSEWSEH